MMSLPCQAYMIALLSSQQESEFWVAIARHHQEARELQQVWLAAGCSMNECAAAFSDGRVIN